MVGPRSIQQRGGPDVVCSSFAYADYSCWNRVRGDRGGAGRCRREAAACAGCGADRHAGIRRARTIALGPGSDRRRLARPRGSGCGWGLGARRRSSPASGQSFAGSVPTTTLKRGMTRLLVQSYAGSKPSGAATASVTIGRRSPGLIRIGSGKRAVAGEVPVVASSSAPTYARLVVNGQTVADLRRHRAIRRHAWLVSRTDRLRFGVNRFRVTAWQADGQYAVKRWTVTRRRDLPLAEAGPGERVCRTRGAGSRSAARSGRASRRGAALAYRWRGLVSAPKGSKPTLRDAGAVKPRFKATQPRCLSARAGRDPAVADHRPQGRHRCGGVRWKVPGCGSRWTRRPVFPSRACSSPPHSNR